MKRSIFLVLLAMASSSFLVAQTHTGGGGGGGAGLAPVTVATLPSSPQKGTIAVVTDGASATDCTVGLGASVVVCQYSGSSWSATAASGSASALSGLTPATGQNTIANGNNYGQIWNWALTTNSHNAFQFGESSAATNGTIGNQYILAVKTASGSTAVPLNVTCSLSGTQTLPCAHITPTWNTTGVVDAALLINVTNTASGTGSLLFDAQVGSVSKASIDKAGNGLFAGTLGVTGHVTLEGVTSTGATGTGNLVFSAAPTLTGHPTVEGITSTGATGTGNFVFSAAPTITGHPTIEGVTSTGATGTGNFVFSAAPTITGHPTIEGVTSTGATGTGLFAFSISPTFSGTLGAAALSATGLGTFSSAGAASTPGLTVTGAPYTGGTATTNFPQVYINDGSGPSTFSTAGTEFGINSPNGFTGNFMDFHVNGGASVAKLDYQGNLTVTSCNGCSGLSFPLTVSGSTNSGGIPYFSNTTTLTASSTLTQYGSMYGGGTGAAPGVVTPPSTNGFYFLGHNVTGSAAVAPTATVSTGLPAGTSIGTVDTGTPAITFGTNSITMNQPVTVSGVNGQIEFTEGTAPTGAGGYDWLYASSSTHRILEIDGAGAAVQLVHAGVDINTSDQVTVTHLTAALPAAQGGSGVQSPSVHTILVGEATSPFNQITAGAADTLLQGQGVAADPAFGTAVPNCVADATHAMQYSTAAHAFQCNSITATAAPAGSDTQIQYNSSSSLGAGAFFTTNKTDTVSIGVASTTVGKLCFYGTGGAGSVCINAASNPSGTWTLPSATDSFVGLATSGTLTNKTYDTQGTGNVFKINGTTITTNIPVAQGGTACTSASITCFNNITGFSAAGTTGTTSTNLVFSTGPSFLGLTNTGVTTLTPVARTSGAAGYFALTIPTDTGQTASTESPGFVTLTGTRTWATTGTVALQRENFFAGPTYASAGASQTFTDVFTLFATPPVQGSNAIFTRNHTFGILDSTSAASSITGGLVVAAVLGTAATSVGIGGGNIYAGGAITAGGTGTFNAIAVTSSTVVSNLNASSVGGYTLGTPVAGGIGYGVSTTQVGTTAALTQYGVLLSGGTGAPTGTAAGAAGNIFMGIASAAPGWLSLSFVASPTWNAGSTMAWDAASKPYASLSLTSTHNTTSTLNPSHLINGGQYVVAVTQDATGTGTTTLGLGTAGTAPTCAAWYVMNSTDYAIATSATVTATANHGDVLAFTYDGTNCWASYH